MKKLFTFLMSIGFIAIVFAQSSNAQLTGTKNIPGNYATLSAAINALNSQGVGTGGVTFNVDAGFTSTEDCPIITATGTSGNQIIFQKNGSGVNPIIKPTGTTATNDAGIKIAGGDYITFDGIDITINTGSAVEYGYYIYNVSATNGAQNNTIKNSKITLNRANTSSRGIYQNVATAPSVATGANSYNKFQSVTIENSYMGIYVTGNATYPDLGIEVSNCIIGAVTANDIGNGSATLNGIRMTSISGANVFGNEVRNVTTTGAVEVYGIFLELLQGTCNIYNNKVHDIKTTNTSTSSQIYGIRTDINSSQTCNVYNNFVYGLEHGMTTAIATQVIRGITVGYSGTGTGNFYYNSVRIAEDAYPSSTAFYVGGGTVNIQNNIFTNFSTAGATSKRYCIYASGGTLNSVSNNDYYIVTTGTGNNVGFYSSADRNTLALWQTATGKDAYSVSGDPGFTSTTDLTPDPANSNSWTLSGNAMQISTITTDFAGASRPSLVSEGAPDIGAYEFTPTSTPNDLTGDNAPADGVTTTFTFFGKTIAKIKWHGTGITYPTLTELHLKYYPGTNPPYGTNGNHYSNCYYTLTKDVGTISTYDITFYYQANQFFNIVASNLRLTKGDGSSTWTPYLITGTLPGQYTIDAGNKTITVYGLSSFSHFSYTDSDAPLPVELSSFTSSVTGRNVNLKWVTASETNNAGFEIQKSVVNSQQSLRRERGQAEMWTKIGYVTGSGTKTTPTNYTFDDRKLNTGKYNYRLKQIDNNGNFEYHNLNGTIEIGVPTKYDISQNYPNPFNPTTKIDFDLPFDSKVSLKLYDMSGRELLTIVNEQKPAGYYTAQVNAGNLSSGAYFYRFTAGNFTATKKMLMIK